MKTRQERLNETRRILAGVKTGTEKQDLDALVMEGVPYWGNILLTEYSKEQLIKMLYLLSDAEFTDEELERGKI